LYFHFRGQYAFDNRLIPQTEQVIGGLYTVRGYDESIVAGDSVYIATAEYRLHLAKAFPYDANPGQFLGRKFRRVPQEPYGAADWDFILRAFFDYGYADVSDALSFENDTATLVGAGIGAELSLYRNINVRLDWGFVLRDVDEAGADAGDNKLHVVATFIF
jgi:hemolysin activation/secretion protein